MIELGEQLQDRILKGLLQQLQELIPRITRRALTLSVTRLIVVQMRRVISQGDTGRHKKR